MQILYIESRLAEDNDHAYTVIFINANGKLQVCGVLREEYSTCFAPFTR